MLYKINYERSIIAVEFKAVCLFEAKLKNKRRDYYPNI